MEIKHIDLDSYGRKIFSAKASPATLNTINIELLGWLSYYSEQLNYLDLAQAKFWSEQKTSADGKNVSDKMIECLWMLRPEGQDHMKAERAVKIIEKLSSGIKSSLRMAEVESRNQA